MFEILLQMLASFIISLCIYLQKDSASNKKLLLYKTKRFEKEKNRDYLIINFLY